MGNPRLSANMWSLKILGERVGIRTRDPLIKSQMLYRLSYTLPHMRDTLSKDDACVTASHNKVKRFA